jgi:PleD family two-component response regulator
MGGSDYITKPFDKAECWLGWRTVEDPKAYLRLKRSNAKLTESGNPR